MAWLRLRDRLPNLFLALRSGWLYAVVVAAGLGGAVALGVHLSNAFPSAERPFGWPGPATFENGVAMVRPALLIVGSLPAVVLASRALPQAFSTGRSVAMTAAVHGVLLIAGVAFGGLVGSWAASSTPEEALQMFILAHALLALAFYALGAAVGLWFPRHPIATSLALWLAAVVFLDDFVKWRLFRTEGYDNLAQGEFPPWFFAVQVLSPVAAYRAVLILDRKGMRDWMEHAALDDSTLPSWMDSNTMAWLMLLVWVALPWALAGLAVRVRILWAARNPARTRPGAREAHPAPALQR